MSWINPELSSLSKPDVCQKPIVRDRAANVRVDPQSGYPMGQRTHGLCEVIQLADGEKLSDRMGLAFFNLRADLEDWTRENCPGAKMRINEPEIFPIDTRQCLVLMTGWIPETIILSV